MPLSKHERHFLASFLLVVMLDDVVWAIFISITKCCWLPFRFISPFFGFGRTTTPLWNVMNMTFSGNFLNYTRGLVVYINTWITIYLIYCSFKRFCVFAIICGTKQRRNINDNIMRTFRTRTDPAQIYEDFILCQQTLFAL